MSEASYMSIAKSDQGNRIVSPRGRIIEPLMSLDEAALADTVDGHYNLKVDFALPACCSSRNHLFGAIGYLGAP
jgi:hypothetical protein